MADIATPWEVQMGRSLACRAFVAVLTLASALPISAAAGGTGSVAQVDMETADGAPIGSGRRWSVSAGLDTVTGLAIFHPTPYVRSSEAYFGLVAGAHGAWRLDDHLTASARLSGALEVTTPNDPAGRRFWPGDPMFQLDHRSLFEDRDVTGIRVGGGLRASVGLSPTSLWRTQLGSLGASVHASRAFLDKRVIVAAAVSGTGFLHRYTSPVGPAQSSDGLAYVLARAGGVEDLGAAAVVSGGLNPLAAAGMSVSASWRILEPLTAAFSLGGNRVWKHTRPIDELSAPTRDVNGDLVVDGGASMDVLHLAGSAAWRLDARWSVSAALSGQATPLTPDNRQIQLPLFNRNLASSQLVVSVTAGF